MKFFKFFIISFLNATSLYAVDGMSWSNCPAFYGNAVQEVFWKSDTKGGTGPNYLLRSGQTFINAGSVCQPGSVFGSEDWIKQLKTSFNPTKSITSFRPVKSAEELQKFLKDLGISVDDQEQLNIAVRAYLAGKPLNTLIGSIPELAPNSAILVGASKQQALITLVKSDGKVRSAVFMQFSMR